MFFFTHLQGLMRIAAEAFTIDVMLLLVHLNRHLF